MAVKDWKNWKNILTPSSHEFLNNPKRVSIEALKATDMASRVSPLIVVFVNYLYGQVLQNVKMISLDPILITAMLASLVFAYFETILPTKAHIDSKGIKRLFDEIEWISNTAITQSENDQTFELHLSNCNTFQCEQCRLICHILSNAKSYQDFLAQQNLKPNKSKTASYKKSTVVPQSFSNLDDSSAELLSDRVKSELPATQLGDWKVWTAKIKL